MPTVLRVDGLRVVIWPNGYRPAHVYVKGAGSEALFILHCPGGPPALRESYGFRLADLNEIEDALAAGGAVPPAEAKRPDLDAASRDQGRPGEVGKSACRRIGPQAETALKT